MRPSRRWSERLRRPDVGRSLGSWNPAERGSASLEFLTAGLLLLVPLVYVVLALSSVQSATFAVEGAARYAARVAVRAADDGAARASVDRVARAVLDEAGLGSSSSVVRVSCDPSPACTAAGARIRVEVASTVTLPLAPDVLGREFAAVRVEGVATQTVSRFAGVSR